MEIRFHNSADETMRMNTSELRKNFLVESLCVDDQLRLVYSHYDRIIIGCAKPVSKKLVLENEEELKAKHFLERREMGIINVGGEAFIAAEGNNYQLSKLDALYLGKGTKDVSFSSADKNDPAILYILSAPAHHTHESRKITRKDASPVKMGAPATSNERTIYKYIHKDGIASCQLVMGLTVLEKGSVWNSVPPHTHTRRMEVYFYFDLDAEQRVFHFMGQPKETRHIVMSNHEAVISPPWSVHFGCGTSNYGFIWGMAGENQEFTDMDPEPVGGLR